ncbi:uncharacterized protein LOC106456974 isoform X1 [Limulus polyphemus]|uniref:Uncharacterized protein LOC106456974 isoform X1 n=1 Tax=Limulus polyphemus TaxID=6850 RepID=A0ABM1S4C6_LIMPO|nr:uncharacterized protein LOC106456974 isoform X1 [Limulus polyphemus]
MLLVMLFSCLLSMKVRQSARALLFVPLITSSSQPVSMSWDLTDEEINGTDDLKSSAKASSLFLLLRKKRDGIAFHVGDLCENTCHDISRHIFCNMTSKRCECQKEFPININNKDCVKAARLWESCKYNKSCFFYDEHAVCNEDGECRCDEGFRSYKAAGEEICIVDQKRGIFENSDITTVIMVVAGLMIGTALFCLVLRLFSRARFGRNRERFGNAAAPSVVLTEMEEPGSVPHSRRPSRCSSSNEYLPSSRRASYSMLAPPASAGSRRSSSGSVRSQSSVRSHASSLRSQSSLRSYRGGRRDSVKRTRSSPIEASTSKFNQLEHRNQVIEQGKEVPALENPLNIKEENDK